MNKRRVFIKQNRECAETPQQACGDLFCVESRSTSQNPLGERLLARGGGGLKAFAFKLISVQESCESDVKKALAFNFVSALFQFSELSHFLGRGRSCACISKLQMRGEGLIQWKTKNGRFLRHCERDKYYDLESQKQTHIFSPVMLNLFQHLAGLACNLFANKILNQVQDDNLTMEGLLCFP